VRAFCCDRRPILVCSWSTPHFPPPLLLPTTGSPSSNSAFEEVASRLTNNVTDV
jgi:hypothetical protein